MASAKAKPNSAKSSPHSHQQIHLSSSQICIRTRFITNTNLNFLGFPSTSFYVARANGHTERYRHQCLPECTTRKSMNPSPPDPLSEQAAIIIECLQTVQSRSQIWRVECLVVEAGGSMKSNLLCVLTPTAKGKGLLMEKSKTKRNPAAYKNDGIQ